MADPYKAGLLAGIERPYAAKRDIRGDLVVVLRGKLENRGLSLITPISRAVLKNEIHELIITDEAGAGPGKTVDRIAYTGFFEVTHGGIILVGDEVSCQGKVLGKIAGFDETHLPNHLNIVIVSKERLDGVEMELELEAQLKITQLG